MPECLFLNRLTSNRTSRHRLILTYLSWCFRLHDGSKDLRTSKFVGNLSAAVGQMVGEGSLGCYSKTPRGNTLTLCSSLGSNAFHFDLPSLLFLTFYVGYSVQWNLPIFIVYLIPWLLEVIMGIADFESAR